MTNPSFLVGEENEGRRHLVSAGFTTELTLKAHHNGRDPTLVRVCRVGIIMTCFNYDKHF